MSRDTNASLIEAGLALAAELSLPAVLQRIIELAADLTDARYGALGVLAPDGSTIEEFITVGISDAERAALGDPPTGRGILGELTRHGRPMRLDDLMADPRAAGFPEHHPPMHSFLGAPVSARGRVFGNIYLTEKRAGERFDDEDERALVVLATQAGVAIENARLFEETQRARAERARLAVMEDRERIAKELHDGAIQSLFAVGMSIQGMAETEPDGPKAASLERSVDEIDRVIRDLRNYIFGLRPGILADRQLDEALRQLASEFERTTGVTTVVEIDPMLAAQLAARAGEMVQLTREALSNVGRHAQATTCRVSLMPRNGEAVLEIDDDGIGIGDVEPGDPGNGLRNIRERGASLGGEATISSIADEGTTISVRFPA